MVAPPSNLSALDRKLLYGMVLVVTSLTALHYYHQIKLARFKLEELENASKV
tara:strand:+ start:7364 stop:7519 length:156 start_codon:yes stop_codon:yes gene_type:complete